jgi:hypothetical protein
MKTDASCDSEIRIVTIRIECLNSSILHLEKLSFFMPIFKGKSR